MKYFKHKRHKIFSDFYNFSSFKEILNIANWLFDLYLNTTITNKQILVFVAGISNPSHSIKLNLPAINTILELACQIP